MGGEVAALQEADRQVWETIAPVFLHTSLRASGQQLGLHEARRPALVRSVGGLVAGPEKPADFRRDTVLPLSVGWIVRGQGQGFLLLELGS